MKQLIVFTTVAIALTLGACNSNSTSTTNNSTSVAFDTTQLAKGATFYQCPMDPEIMSDKPGTCSKCGMDLEKVEKK